MRAVFLFFYFIFSAVILSAQKYIAIVTLKNNATSYIDVKGIPTYSESIDPAVHEAICKFNNGFARARRTNKFYFINEFGKPIFPIAYDKAEDFKEGFAMVKLNGKWGFINQKGETVIKHEFYEVHPFSSGLSNVALGPKEKHGFIDSTGNFIIKPQFDNASSFVNDRAWVSLNGKWGIINKTGEFVLKPTYKDVKNVYEHYNQFSPDYPYSYITEMINKDMYRDNNYTWTSLDEKWGLVNKNGEVLVTHQYTEVKDVSEGFTWVKQGEFWGMIDSVGNYLIKPNERNNLIYGSNPSIRSFCEFRNGLIRFQSKNMYGYMDTHLNIVIPAKFDKATEFKNGVAYVNQDGYFGLIDVTGKFIIPINYKEIIVSDNGLFPVKDDNGDWGYLNLKNEWVIKPQFKKATPFQLAKQ